MLKEYIDTNMDFHLFNLFICFNNKLNYILRKANVLLYIDILTAIVYSTI